MSLGQLENIIGYKFRRPELLLRAVTHSSYANEATGNPTNGNERLEFLGDAILDAVVSIFLYESFSDKEEGDLTKLRASVVCEKALGKVGKSLGINEFVLLGKGESICGGRDRMSIIADMVEAIIGAVYLDGGVSAATAVVSRLLTDTMRDAISGNVPEDGKTALQELLQKGGDTEITYRIISEEGPDHAKLFTAEVSARGAALGAGTGTNKKEAEQEAARNALKKIQKLKRGNGCISKE